MKQKILSRDELSESHEKTIENLQSALDNSNDEAQVKALELCAKIEELKFSLSLKNDNLMT